MTDPENHTQKTKLSNTNPAKSRVKSYAPQGSPGHALLVIFVVLLLLNTFGDKS